MSEFLAPPEETLVKYDRPCIISTYDEKETGEKDGVVAGLPKCYQPKTVPNETIEILNKVIPPKEWKTGGQLWRQVVSTSPASLLDARALQEQLDMLIHQRGARETGLCNVRRDLYDQCFDELIRQVTIDCAERGLLLLRVRNELRMSLAAYSMLYSSCIAFGVRKALAAEDKRAEYCKELNELEDAKKALEKQVMEQRSRVEQIEKAAVINRENEERTHNEQVQFYKKQNQQLKSQLEGILAPKK